MNLKYCYNFKDFRKLAKKKLPSPIFHYIDGGSDDEITFKRNTDSFNDCDLVPNVLASVGAPDLSTTIFGKKIELPIFLLPPQCKDFIIMKEIKCQQEQQTNLELFIACQPWQIILLKKYQIFLEAQNYSSFMFIKINPSQMT